MSNNKEVTINALTYNPGKKVNVILTPIEIRNFHDKTKHITSYGLM